MRHAGLIVLCAAALASGAPPASQPEQRDGADAPPAIKWERRGAASGRAIIFLPALGFPGSCWSKVAESFEKDHPIYLVTYAGTDNIPPTKPPYLGRIMRDIRVMIDQEQLKEPILAGHLLGGHIALSVAGTYPEAVGGVFCMPLIGPRPPPKMRREAALKAMAYYARGNDEMWEANLSMEAARAVEDPAIADQILKTLQKADRATYAGLIGDFFADVIEARLPKVQCPVCLVALVGRPRDSGDPDTKQMKPQEYARTVVDRMRGLYPGLARCDTMSLRGTRIVPLYDHPDRVVLPLERFLSKLANPAAPWGTTKGVENPPESHESGAGNAAGVGGKPKGQTPGG